MSLILCITIPGQHTISRPAAATSVVRATREAGMLAQSSALGTRIDVLDGAGGRVVAVVTRAV